MNRIEVSLQQPIDLLQLARQFELATLLTSADLPNYPDSHYNGLYAFGAKKVLSCHSGSAIDQLEHFQKDSQDWLFGCLGYDLKNEVEALSSNNFDGIHLPDLLFYQPKFVITEERGQFTLHCHAGDVDAFFEHCQHVEEASISAAQQITLEARISEADYLATIEQIQRHIQLGDCYEMNFCQEFYCEGATIDPYETFDRLSASAQAPFMAFFKTGQQFLLCSSPERFLKKEGNQLLSQPIKGTAKRGNSAVGDAFLKQQLEVSHKDKTENVMIVDLVRNDLGRIAVAGSVEVKELFGVYTFPHVHQMISTITATLKPEIGLGELLKNTFPMGSMTGAPKVKVMQLTEELEQTKRGWYSGAVGYIAPNGDFDFNVVIRSLLYHAERAYLSCQVGGGITAGSIPQKEYEECLVKIAGIQRILNPKE